MREGRNEKEGKERGMDEVRAGDDLRGSDGVTR